MNNFYASFRAARSSVKIPKVGERVRDERSGQTGVVRRLIGQTGPGGGWLVEIAHEGAHTGRRAALVTVPLQNVVRLL